MKKIKKFDQHLYEKNLKKFSKYLDKGILEGIDQKSTDGDLEKSRAARIKVNKALVWINVRRGFFGRLLADLNIYGSSKIETMQTNGLSIGYGVDFVLGQSDAAIRFVLCHEVLHCVADHMGRRGNRDPYMWNVAADYAINPILNDEVSGDFGWPLMPDGSKMGLYDQKYEGMRAEDIYDMIIEEEGPDKAKKKAIEWEESGRNFGEVLDSDEDLAPPDNEEDILQSPELSAEEEDEIWDEIDDDPGQPGGGGRGKNEDPEEPEEPEEEGIKKGDIIKITEGPNKGKYGRVLDIEEVEDQMGDEILIAQDPTVEILSDEEVERLKKDKGPRY